MSPTPREKLGRHGEQLAARYLAAQGYEIIERNWRCRAGELDIIARQGGEWVFIEVRTRRAQDTSPAIESITEGKEARILAAAEAYLQAHELDEVSWRVDLAVVALSTRGPQIEIIRDATGW